jgi:hypothetical protein
MPAHQVRRNQVPVARHARQRLLLFPCQVPPVHARRRSSQTQVRPIEDTAGVKTAVVETLNALLGKTIDAKQAGLILYGLQIVAQKVDDDRSSPRDTVRYTSRSKKGDELAPELCVKEQGWGKSYEDCSECPHRATCNDLEDDEEEDAPEEDSQKPNENGIAKTPSAASSEDKSPQSSPQHRVIAVEDINAANFNQAIDSMSPFTLLKTYLKLNSTGSPGS